MKIGDWVMLAIVTVFLLLVLIGVYNTPCAQNVFCSPYGR